jgi:photosystem II stability/assembly factor-like uncharacterized protein
MSDRIVVSTRKGLFFVDRGDAGWAISKTAFLGDNVTSAFVDPRDGAIYASLEHGHFGAKMHRSDDGGETWPEIGSPTYPEKPEGVEGEPKDPHPWKVEKGWSLVPGAADQPGLLWCGTIPGGLFKSTDRGESWELVRSLWDHPKRKEWFGGGTILPGIHSIVIDPRDSARVLIGISCGGVWETRDTGATWEVKATGMRANYLPPEMAHEPNLQDPHCVVMCKSAPDTLWCQHHNGIFRSTDGAESWVEIPEADPSVFGFAVAVHPDEPDTAWFVPAIKDEKRIPVDGKVVVGRTRDGGASFEILRNGLPQDHAYDITFRHALDIDESGDCLVFGSTTGSVYVTEDQGDSWITITEHLPPVYTVRFAPGS